MITPGTVTDEALLEQRRDNLLLAIAAGKRGYGIAWVDLAGGRFLLSEVGSAGSARIGSLRVSPRQKPWSAKT